MTEKAGVPRIDPSRKVYDDRDEKYWAEMERLVSEYGISFSELLINYPAFIRRRELPRLLADYELFKMIENIPGSIVELGVYLGAGLFTWGNFLETFLPGNRVRKAYGFESGEGYQDLGEEDGDVSPWLDNIIGKKKMDADFVKRMLALKNEDNLIPGLERCRLIVGDIKETVPIFASNSQGNRLSMIYFDVNVYEPTIVGLRELYPLLVPGGVVAFNGYGAPPWEGEARALEEYFKEIGEPLPVMKNFTFSVHPSAYFVKK